MVGFPARVYIRDRAGTRTILYIFLVHPHTPEDKVSCIWPVLVFRQQQDATVMHVCLDAHAAIGPINHSVLNFGMLFYTGYSVS